MALTVRARRRAGLLLLALALYLGGASLLGDGNRRAEAQTGPVISSAAFPSIQAAIDSLQSTGGAVYIPVGTHLINAKLRVHSNITVFGAGMDQTIIRFAPGTQVDHMMSNATLTAGNSNIVIRDLTLGGNGETRADCCFGLRLVNVRNSFVIGVAADNHSSDGFYLGYNGSNGSVQNRLSGCRASGNGRNGIALTHGSGNVIDGCQVSGNNRREAVAGIDLEPDQGQNVSGNKVVSNTANGQNVGIQLYAYDRSQVTLSNNVVCTNTATSNVNAGIFDFNGNANVYVNNVTSGNGNNLLVDPSALIGPEYANQCTLGALPGRPPQPGASATPTPSTCAQRPRISVTSLPMGGGRLQVTVAVERPSSAPSNSLRSLRFGIATHGVIDIGTTVGSTGGFTYTPPAGSQQTTFIVRRSAPGSVTIPFIAVDDCGDWPTFVGGGPGAF